MAAEFTSPLDSVRVASPCSADWDAMIGNNRQRFCGQCKMNVYNLSEMTKAEAENLISNAEGRLCARFYKRSDGTVITKDCPVGWQAAKKRMTAIWTALASVLFTALGSIGVTAYLSKADGEIESTGKISVRTLPEDKIFDENFNGKSKEKPEFLMGNMAVPEDSGAVVTKGEIAIVEN